ncbi:MAG TPA: anti-sigma factor [Anaerolineae bacterium]|nr:anti-sigma factor [Anaerolineae bacterium]
MQDQTHVHDSLPAYALHCLDAEEALRVAEHLARCAECRAALLAYEAVVDRLALGAPDATPPARLKGQIMERIQPPQVAQRAPARREGRPWWQRAAPAWGLAALVLLVALVASNLWWWQRSADAGQRVGPADMQVVAMTGTETAPGASGSLLITADGEYGTLIVDGLPALDPGLGYQLWLIRDGQRVSGGVFDVNDEGYGVLEVSSPEPLSSYTAFGVTVEPESGSPGPTGDKVLDGSV